MNILKNIVAPTIAGIIVALILIVLVQSALLASKPAITKWKVKTVLPVEKFYNIVEKILDNESMKCLLKAQGKNDIFIVVPLSYSYITYRTIGEVYVALNTSYPRVGKIIIVPYAISTNVTLPSRAALASLNYTLKLIKYCKENGYKKFMKLIRQNSTLITRELENVTVSNIRELSKKIFYESIILARSAAIYGLLQKLQYYSFISQIMPIFIVCSSSKHICVAATLDELNNVITDVMTQVPYGYSK
ncbi:MAG: hypothetical protein GXO10_00520 [Crenarchaeota archaeon]|nr:hypothetical protein [Thermoproteota archaeon]